MKISDLPFSNRTRNCLEAAGIRTIDDLKLKSEYELLRLPSFGRKSLDEIRLFLGEEINRIATRSEHKALFEKEFYSRAEFEHISKLYQKAAIAKAFFDEIEHTLEGNGQVHGKRTIEMVIERLNGRSISEIATQHKVNSATVSNALRKISSHLKARIGKASS